MTRIPLLLFTDSIIPYVKNIHAALRINTCGLSSSQLELTEKDNQLVRIVFATPKLNFESVEYLLFQNIRLIGSQELPRIIRLVE